MRKACAKSRTKAKRIRCTSDMFFGRRKIDGSVALILPLIRIVVVVVVVVTVVDSVDCSVTN